MAEGGDHECLWWVLYRYPLQCSVFRTLLASLCHLQEQPFETPMQLSLQQLPSKYVPLQEANSPHRNKAAFPQHPT
jgi:hypothetical protein